MSLFFTLVTIESAVLAGFSAIATVVTILAKLLHKAWKENRTAHKEQLQKCIECRKETAFLFEKRSAEYTEKLNEFSKRNDDNLKRYEKKMDALMQEYINTLKDFADIEDDD